MPNVLPSLILFEKVVLAEITVTITIYPGCTELIIPRGEAGLREQQHNSTTAQQHQGAIRPDVSWRHLLTVSVERKVGGSIIARSFYRDKLDAICASIFVGCPRSGNRGT